MLAEEALVVLRRHGWFLVPEVVVFALFSDKTSLDEKSRIATRILSHGKDKPGSYKLEKQKFPIINESTQLVDLVSPLSYKFFDILQIDCSWLEDDPESLKNNEDFSKAKEFVSTVKVTNDVAERGIKLASNYASILTGNEEMKSMILHAVEKTERISLISEKEP